MTNAVFISAPYSSNPEENTKNAIDVADRLLDNNILPLVPHMWHFHDQYHKRSYDIWLQMSFELMLRADAILVLPGESEGRDKEVQFANDNGIPVFDTLEELIQCLVEKPTQHTDASQIQFTVEAKTNGTV